MDLVIDTHPSTLSILTEFLFLPDAPTEFITATLWCVSVPTFQNLIKFL